MKSLFKYILLTLAISIYGIGVNSMLHTAVAQNELANTQAEQVDSTLTLSYSGLLHLPVSIELVNESTTDFQELKPNYLSNCDVSKRALADFTNPTIWRGEQVRSSRINLSLSVKDIIFPFHTFS